MTNEVGRLCDEIVALRENRVAMLHALASDTAAMQDAVSGMLADFGSTRADRAHQTQTTIGKSLGEVRSSVEGLKQQIGSFRQEFQSDLQGARRAWLEASAGSFRRRPRPEQSTEPAPKPKKRKR